MGQDCHADKSCIAEIFVLGGGGVKIWEGLLGKAKGTNDAFFYSNLMDKKNSKLSQTQNLTLFYINQIYVSLKQSPSYSYPHPHPHPCGVHVEHGYFDKSEGSR